MKIRPVALAVAGAALGLVFAAPAQRGQPVLRVSTRLVEVNVVVQDKKGEPIPDLSRDDFVLLDEGREQKIDVFSVESSRPLSAPAKVSAPNTFSNRLEARGAGPGSVTAILLDALNTHFEDQVYAKAQIVKFLEQIQPTDRVALYTLGTNLRVLHDFTGDTRLLVAALARYAARESPELQASEPEPPPASITLITPNLQGVPTSAPSVTPVEVGIDAYLRETSQRSADYFAINRALRTLNALEAIANRLSNLPGRKNLVWVSASFPFTVGVGPATGDNVIRGQRDLSPEMARVERALNNANLAIYPVDARGLVGPFGVNPNTSATRSVSARAPTQPTIEGIGQLTPTQDTMEELADRTGGRAFYGTNDIFGAIRRALEDSRVTYVLGYYPQNVKWDGKFHEIKVRVRRSGVRVLFRRGYFALTERPVALAERQGLMLNAASSPLDATRVALTVHLDQAAQPAPNVLPLTVSVDPQSLSLKEQDHRWTGSVDFLFAQLSAEGRVLTALEQNLNLNLTAQEYQRALRNDLSISGRLQIVSGAESVRVIALDGESGGLGTVTVPLGTRAAR